MVRGQGADILRFIDRPGLGVEVDEEKLAFYMRLFDQNDQFLPYGSPRP